METNDLEKLAKKYGADKGSKHKNYCGYYYQLFSHKRAHIKKVLEIGIAEGAGLFMWKDFFPNAQVLGADIDPVRVELCRRLDPKRIRTLQADQSKKEDLIDLILWAGPDVDIVIDDGSHNPKDQVFTAKTLMPLLDKGVIYVIEDVANDNIVKELSEYKWSSVRWPGRYDDSLVILEHK